MSIPVLCVISVLLAPPPACGGTSRFCTPPTPRPGVSSVSDDRGRTAMLVALPLGALPRDSAGREHWVQGVLPLRQAIRFSSSLLSAGCSECVPRVEK